MAKDKKSDKKADDKKKKRKAAKTALVRKKEEKKAKAKQKAKAAEKEKKAAAKKKGAKKPAAKLKEKEAAKKKASAPEKRAKKASAKKQETAPEAEKKEKSRSKTSVTAAKTEKTKAKKPVDLNAAPTRKPDEIPDGEAIPTGDRKEAAKEPPAAKTALRRVIETPLGHLSIETEGEALTAIRFTEDAPGGDESPLIAEAQRQLDAYFAGTRRAFNLPLAIRGTEFQRAVYEALLRIPFGEVKSYEEVAVSIGRDRAYRAVGGAVGKNPLTVVVPCHRVVRKDGSPGGYSGGLGRKEALLALEGH